MKKITFLLILFTVSLGYSQTLPFDFSNGNQAFTAVNTTSTTIIPEPGNTSNNVLQIVGPASEWDNSEITLATPVDLSNSVSNSISFRIKTDGDYGTRRHLLKLLGGTAGGADIELFFDLDAGTDWQTISLDADDAPQFNAAAASFQKLLLFTDAGDVNTGTYLFDDISAPEAAPETCSDGILNQDETAVDCGGSVCAPCDVVAPTTFTATAGTIGAYSVELLLTATDDSGSVTYDVSYTNSGAQTATVTGVSATQKSLVISDLISETAYSFAVSAKDASGNTATNNPLTVSATTTADTSTACAGTSSEVQQGTLNSPYDYAFETLSNGDVRMTFELAVTGLVAYAWRETPFQETGMTVTGNVATIDLTGLTSGNDISYGVKFVWAAGGFAVTKYFTYTVGDDCSTASVEDFSANAVKLYPNPAKGVVNFSTVSNETLEVSVYDLLGKQVLRAENVQSQLNISSLNPGMYFVNMKQGSNSSTQKLLIN